MKNDKETQQEATSSVVGCVHVPSSCRRVHVVVLKGRADSTQQVHARHKPVGEDVLCYLRWVAFCGRLWNGRPSDGDPMETLAAHGVRVGHSKPLEAGQRKSITCSSQSREVLHNLLDKCVRCSDTVPHPTHLGDCVLNLVAVCVLVQSALILHVRCHFLKRRIADRNCKCFRTFCEPVRRLCQQFDVVGGHLSTGTSCLPNDLSVASYYVIGMLHGEPHVLKETYDAGATDSFSQKINDARAKFVHLVDAGPPRWAFCSYAP